MDWFEKKGKKLKKLLACVNEWERSPYFGGAYDVHQQLISPVLCVIWIRYSLPPRVTHVVSRALVWFRWIILFFFIFLSFLSSHLDFRICILQKNKVGCPKNFSVKFGPYFYYCYFYKLFFFQLHPLILNLLGIEFCNFSYLLWRNPSLMTRFASLLSWPKFDQVFFIIIF
jgi:hypothetical protein